jgi:hypothetical protein
MSIRIKEMPTTDWNMINNPTSKQALSEDPWLSSNFRTQWFNLGGGASKPNFKCMRKAELIVLAKAHVIVGRSKMCKAELVNAIQTALRKQKRGHV